LLAKRRRLDDFRPRAEAEHLTSMVPLTFIVRTIFPSSPPRALHPTLEEQLQTLIRLTRLASGSLAFLGAGS
jgi:hypothetical protein